jgi:RimJ/RimL family protein N-acetyltransferase
LQTPRLVLRVPQIEDAFGIADYLEDPEAMRFLGGATVARAEAPGVIDRWRDRWRDDGMGHFVVERRSDTRVLGRVSLVVWDTRTWRQATLTAAAEHAQPELGWALARAHWGHGYATEAALAAREWARRERHIGRLISLIAPENAASQRVAQRLGARLVDTVVLADAGAVEVWKHPDDSGY